MYPTLQKYMLIKCVNKIDMNVHRPENIEQASELALYQ